MGMGVGGDIDTTPASTDVRSESSMGDIPAARTMQCDMSELRAMLREDIGHGNRQVVDEITAQMGGRLKLVEDTV